jgi:tRNA (guanine10-N2)-methyltransferase
MVDLVNDLVDYASRMLTVGGRLVFWLPTVTEEYDTLDIPEHPAIRLRYDSAQQFGKWARRLITMEKIRSWQVGDAIQLSVKPAHSKFLETYWAKPCDAEVIRR